MSNPTLKVLSEKYELGDTAYIVRHTPYWPSPEEVAKLEAAGTQPVDEAEYHVRRVVFTNLARAITFARRVVKTDFWGQCEVYEARLSNPYPDDIPDHRIKREALVWQQVEGGYECTIEK